MKPAALCPTILLVFAALSGGVPPAHAQIKPQATAFTTPGCEQYAVSRPPDAVLAPDVAGELRPCIEALRKAISQSPAEEQVARGVPTSVAAEAVRVAEEAAPGSTEEQKHLKLRKIYLAYANIRLWKECALRAPAGGSTPRRCEPAKAVPEPERSLLIAAFGEFSEALHLALKGHGLSQPFAATLVTAFSFQDAGTSAATGDPAGEAEGNDAGGQAGAAGFVVFESVHFFACPERWFDLDISGTLGFRPALTMLRPEEDAAGALIPKYQQAFVWSAVVEPNFRIADLAEAGVFFGGGQTILNDTHSLIENGANSQVAVTSGSDTGAYFLEVGAKVGIFAETLDLLHLSKGLLSPMLGFSVGYRRDQRFERIEVPEGTGDPRDRLFVRLATSAIPLTDSARPDQPFTLTFSLEHEWARQRGSGAVPPGTRVLVRGDLNLFKATNPK